MKKEDQVLITLNMQFLSHTLASFQVLNRLIWLVATILVLREKISIIVESIMDSDFPKDSIRIKKVWGVELVFESIKGRTF